MMAVTKRGLALVRRTSPQPANDNVPGTITPDDRRFFLVLSLICAGVVGLAAYVALSGPDDVMAVLRR